MIIAITWLLGYCAAAYFYDKNRADGNKKVTHAMALVTLICWPYVFYVEVKKCMRK